ncbi:zinc-binding alcohol dehydrogenase family protein [Streptacidiphilus sp. P02-A3a]|uniref:quinone oxidoreductase family protein n=1 Tax=Streptacidiphilus sp. P02-A3a TaxID=2704468 RepID=UPI0015F979AE|nr:zinc-binding alcohol dehydrogenase family protein [Streptacidiphilus sp. P02-A3a]QMU67356.1 zinc-binding alcohol dehydrogenase family protein [Streptacidiphilus sp. P02-A3a]
MRAALLRSLGERPACEDVPEPRPADGEVTVSVSACPLTNLDRARAAGRHFSAPARLPAICGSQAAGTLANGTRVLFRAAGGAMAERAVTRPAWCTPIPDGVDDAFAAAIQNPGVSAWTALAWRAKLRPGESVLVLGATGVAGQVAVQLARQLGAGRIVAAGRNPRVLAALPSLGADAILRLDRSDAELARSFRAEAAASNGFDVVLDYVWGQPTKVFIDTLGADDMELRFSRTRLVQIGVMAAQELSLSAEVLRSSGLEIVGSGTGNAPPLDVLGRHLDLVLDLLARGRLRIAVNRVRLAEVDRVWDLDQRGHRTVLIP